MQNVLVLLSWVTHQYVTISRTVLILLSWHLNYPFLLHTWNISRSAEWISTKVYIEFIKIFQRYSLFRYVTQRRLVISYRRFGTNYRSHLQGSTCPRSLNSLTLEDKTKGLSRNVDDYWSTLRNIPEERRCHLHRGGGLKARINYSRLCSK